MALVFTSDEHATVVNEIFVKIDGVVNAINELKVTQATMITSVGDNKNGDL